MSKVENSAQSTVCHAGHVFDCLVLVCGHLDGAAPHHPRQVPEGKIGWEKIGQG